MHERHRAPLDKEAGVLRLFFSGGGGGGRDLKAETQKVVFVIYFHLSLTRIFKLE